jgi:hypothetical protein
VRAGGGFRFPAGFEPRPRVANRVDGGAVGEAGFDGARHVEAADVVGRRQPKGHFGIRRDVSRDEELARSPSEPRVARGDVSNRLKQRAHRHVLARTRRIEDTVHLPFGSAHHPIRQVAHIDELHNGIRVAWREHLAASPDPSQPISEAIVVVVGAEDGPCPDDERATRQDFLHGSFARSFERAVDVE